MAGWSVERLLLNGAVCLFCCFFSFFCSRPKGRDKLVDQLVYGLMYGALPPCPECANQALSFKDGEFVCGGMASEWGRCLYKSAEVKHAEWDLSESSSDYLSSFKFKFMKKPVEAYAFFAAETRAAAEQHKVITAAADEAVKARQQQLLKQSVLDELLDGFDICVVGAKHADGQGGTKTLKEVKALVEAHGGALVSDVDDADMIIAAAEGEAGSSNKKLKQAAADKKPVLLASFLFDSIAKSELQDPQSYSALAAATADQQGDGWTGLKDKVQTGRQKSGAKLSGASGAAAAGGGKSVGKSSGGKVTVKVKGRAAVDDDSGLADTAHVLEERDDVWAVTLNITDISTGVNSYYILQLIEADARGAYTVFRKWGRVGTDIGNHKISAHGSSKDSAKQEVSQWEEPGNEREGGVNWPTVFAIADSCVCACPCVSDSLFQFKEVYLDKTGNRWDERKNFVKKAGKFYPIDASFTPMASRPAGHERQIEAHWLRAHALTSMSPLRVYVFVLLLPGGLQRRRRSAGRGRQCRHGRQHVQTGPENSRSHAHLFRCAGHQEDAAFDGDRSDEGENKQRANSKPRALTLLFSRTFATPCSASISV